MLDPPPPLHHAVWMIGVTDRFCVFMFSWIFCKCVICFLQPTIPIVWPLFVNRQLRVVIGATREPRFGLEVRAMSERLREALGQRTDNPKVGNYSRRCRM